MDFLSITRLEEGQFVPVISIFLLEALLNELSTEADQMLKKGQKLICSYELGHLEMKSDDVWRKNLLFINIKTTVFLLQG